MKNHPKSPSARCGGEPPLAELMDDPMLQTLMARDHVDRDDLRALIHRAQQHLAGPAVKTQPPAECCA